MNYKEFIDNILNTRGRFACGDEYKERHHIVPKCMGGTNDEENLIDLYAREHFEAHRLLALENPENDSLIYAWWMMAHINNANQRDYEITAEEYEEAKINFSKKISGKNNPMYGIYGEKHPSYGIKRFGKDNPFYGKKHTYKTKERIRQANLGRKMSEDTKKKIAEANRNRKITEETREKLKKINLGKKLSENTKRKISKSKKGIHIGEKNPNYGNHKLAGKNNPNAKIICQFDLNLNILNMWNFIKEASQVLNIHPNAISICCRHKTQTSGGFKWYYLYDQTKKDGTIIQGAISLGLITEEEALKMLESKGEE